MRCWEISAFESWFRSFCPTRVFSSHFPGTRYVRDRLGQLSILNFYTSVILKSVAVNYTKSILPSSIFSRPDCELENRVKKTRCVPPPANTHFFTLSMKPSFFNIIIVTIIVVSNVHLGIYNCRSIILPVSSLLYSNPRHHHHQHHRLTNIILVTIIILVQYHYCHHPCHYRILIIWRSLARESVRTFILWRTSPASLSIGSRSTFARFLVIDNHDFEMQYCKDRMMAACSLSFHQNHFFQALPPTVESRTEVKKLNGRLQGAYYDAEYGLQ